MKALVLTAPNQLRLMDVDDPVPGEGEVLLAVGACGICGSDVHGMDGSTGRRIPPVIMGHEAAGTIAALGPGVGGWTEGQRVTFDSTLSCGQCPFCRRGQINLCNRRRVLGVSCAEYRCNGAFAQYVVVPQRILYRLPGELSLERAALVEPLSVAVHAAGRLDAQPDESAVVIGAGTIGLLAIQVLRCRGCRVAAVDVEADRLELARRLGAELATSPPGAADALRDWSGGAGADLALEAVGADATVHLAIDCLRKGGRLALVGNLVAQAELPLQAVVTRELTLYGSCASAGEYPACLDLMARGQVDVDLLISATAPLADGPQWFARLQRKQSGLLKVILRP